MKIFRIVPAIALSLTAIPSITAQQVTLLEQATLPSSSTTPATVGLPTNNGAFWDGTNYWLSYGEGTELRAKYGTSLATLQDTATNPAGGNSADDFAFGETEWTFKVSNGYVYEAINVGDSQDPKVGGDIVRDGNFGNRSEWKRNILASGTCSAADRKKRRSAKDNDAIAK